MIINSKYIKYLPPCDKFTYELIFNVAKDINAAILYFLKNNKQHLIISNEEQKNLCNNCCSISAIKSLWMDVLIFTSSAQLLSRLQASGFKATGTYNSFINYPFVKTDSDTIIKFLLEEDE